MGKGRNRSSHPHERGWLHRRGDSESDAPVGAHGTGTQAEARTDSMQTDRLVKATTEESTMTEAELRAAIAATRDVAGTATTTTATALEAVADAAATTLMKTRDVQTWLVWHAFKDGGGKWRGAVAPYSTEANAKTQAAFFAKFPKDYAEISVTGPYTQKVPA